MHLNPDDLEIAGFFVLVAVFEICERLRPARDINRLSDLKIDLLSFSLAVAINRVLTAFFRSFGSTLAPGPSTGWLANLHALPGVVKIVMALILVDFTIYWIHRSQHRFDSFWRTHAWHHTIENMYWLAGFRTSFMHSFV